MAFSSTDPDAQGAEVRTGGDDDGRGIETLTWETLVRMLSALKKERKLSLSISLSLFLPLAHESSEAQSRHDAG